eukprot:TRINITY_DN29463_c0_g1_i1.p1 TRINITY_DN29463_c0_g1~~TRINITY_DN29463_c0_g1_i1.p1  ORF type:complete len:295 (-),score=46.57 TRINITY_DN29463_c0_g1_i1:539-1423(-)
MAGQLGAQQWLQMLTCCRTYVDGDEVAQTPVWKGGSHKWMGHSDEMGEEMDAMGTHLDPTTTRIHGPGGQLETKLARLEELIPDEVPELVIEDPPRPGCCAAVCCKREIKLSQLPGTFSVTLDCSKQGSDHGLIFCEADMHRLVISNVKKGGSLMDAWNKGAPKLSMVSAGDRILEVDGHAGSAKELLHRIQSCGHKMELTLQHPRTISANISRDCRSLGLTVTSDGNDPNALGLLVRGVGEDGAIADFNYNSKHSIRQGARIVCINGVRIHKSMLEMLKSNEYLDMKIVDWVE